MQAISLEEARTEGVLLVAQAEELLSRGCLVAAASVARAAIDRQTAMLLRATGAIAAGTAPPSWVRGLVLHRCGIVSQDLGRQMRRVQLVYRLLVCGAPVGQYHAEKIVGLARELAAVPVPFAEPATAGGVL
jgi:hypothetical protein